VIRRRMRSRKGVQMAKRGEMRKKEVMMIRENKE
jgi:hypothetical protein